MRNPVLGASLAVLLSTAGCSDAVTVETPSSGDAGAGAGGSSSVAGSAAGEGASGGFGGRSATTGGLGGATTAGYAGGGGSAALAGHGGDAPSGGSGGGGAGSGGGGTSTMPPACETNQKARCTGASPMVCDFGGAVGDYAVTLELGGPDASNTYVEAETYRRVVPSVELAAGQTQRFTFGVNVRQPEGQPIQDVPAGTPGLQLYLRGTAPSLTSVCVSPLSAKPKLWIAGDSTVCDQSDTSYAGWGQHLPQYFDAPLVVANYADSGESSSSVLGSAKLWGAIKAGWKAGDWVLVQVGHNDKDVTAATFKSNITAFVTQAKSASVHIVLVTPISRVGYTLAAEHQSSAGANIPQIIKDVGMSEQVPVIDLTTLTWNWLQTVDWKKYFALGTDKTHTNPAGAEVVASLVRDAIRAQELELSQYLR